MSYTTFEYSDLKVSNATIADGDLKVTATATITNTGSVTGSEVVQLYVALPQTADPALTHVPLALRAFAKVRDLAPGKSAVATLELDKYAASYWEARIGSWSVDAGTYVVKVGPSSAVLPLVGTFVIEKGFEWNGL